MKARLLGLLGGSKTDASGPKRALPPARKQQERLDRYQSVSVVHASKCCEAVKSLAGKRFLAGGAPPLPLPTCNLSDQCKCSFKKHVDRRDYDRRLAGEMSKWYGGAEKRRSRGRRRVD